MLNENSKMEVICRNVTLSQTRLFYLIKSHTDRQNATHISIMTVEDSTSDSNRL